MPCFLFWEFLVLFQIFWRNSKKFKAHFRALYNASPIQKVSPSFCSTSCWPRGFFYCTANHFWLWQLLCIQFFWQPNWWRLFWRGGYQYPISDFHAGIVGQLSSCRNEGQMGGIRAGQCWFQTMGLETIDIDISSVKYKKQKISNRRNTYKGDSCTSEWRHRNKFRKALNGCAKLESFFVSCLNHGADV